MKVVGTPENPPQTPVMLDPRDYARIRDRLLDLEEAAREQRHEIQVLRSQLLDVQRQFAFFMQGSKERFDALSVLLAGFSSEVARKDV